MHLHIQNDELQHFIDQLTETMKTKQRTIIEQQQQILNIKNNITDEIYQLQQENAKLRESNKEIEIATSQQIKQTEKRNQSVSTQVFYI